MATDEKRKDGKRNDDNEESSSYKADTTATEPPKWSPGPPQETGTTAPNDPAGSVAPTVAPGKRPSGAV